MTTTTNTPTPRRPGRVVMTVFAVVLVVCCTLLVGDFAKCNMESCQKTRANKSSSSSSSRLEQPQGQQMQQTAAVLVVNKKAELSSSSSSSLGVDSQRFSTLTTTTTSTTTDDANNSNPTKTIAFDDFDDEDDDESSSSCATNYTYPAKLTNYPLTHPWDDMIEIMPPRIVNANKTKAVVIGATTKRRIVCVFPRIGNYMHFAHM